MNKFNSRDFVQEMNNMENVYHHYKQLVDNDNTVKSMVTSQFVKTMQTNLSLDDKVQGTLAWKVMTKYPSCQDYVGEVKDAIDNLYSIKNKNAIFASNYIKKYMIRLRKELNKLLEDAYSYSQRVSINHKEYDYDMYKKNLDKFTTRYQVLITVMRIGATTF